VVTSLLGLALVLSPSANVQAAELRLLAGGAMSGVWADIKPQFEQASGHRLEIFFGTTPNLIKEAASGKPFDVGLVPVEVMQDASARAKFVASPTIDIAHVGLGVAVRSGAQSLKSATQTRSKQRFSRLSPLSRSRRAPPVIQSQRYLIALESLSR
jgi:molybdate transport system substrate-binding protein